MFTTVNPTETTVRSTTIKCIQYALDLCQYEKAVHSNTLEFVKYGLENGCYGVSEMDLRGVKAELLMLDLLVAKAEGELEAFLLEMSRKCYLTDGARPLWGFRRKSFGVELSVALEYVKKYEVKSYSEFFA